MISLDGLGIRLMGVEHDTELIERCKGIKVEPYEQAGEILTPVYCMIQG